LFDLFLGHVRSLWTSKALRIDVDDCRQPGLSHRRRRRRKQLPGAPGHTTRLIRLRDELRTVAPAQTEERRRAEDLDASHPFAHLLERAGHGTGLRPADEDANEMAERRVPEVATALHLTGQEPTHVMSRRELDGPRIRLERLDQDPAGCVTAAPTRQLRQ
jgi:hypothetical protein